MRAEHGNGTASVEGGKLRVACWNAGNLHARLASSEDKEVSADKLAWLKWRLEVEEYPDVVGLLEVTASSVSRSCCM